MKINNLGYLLKDGFRGIFRHGFMSFAAVCVTVACLLIVGSFSILVYNVNIMVEDLNKTNEVMVYVDETYDEQHVLNVGTQINMIANVSNSRYVSRDQALKDFVADHDNDPALSGIDPETLRHRYVVTLIDNEQIEATVQKLRTIEGVADISASYELAEGFSTLQNILHIASIAVISVLLVVSLLIISNTVKLAMYDRRDEIAIMKMVGATNAFIRLPFQVEGFTLGMIGSILAFGLEWVGYDYMIQRIGAVDSLQLFSFVSFQELLIPMVAVFGGAGVFVGLVGSGTAIRKFMDV